MSHFLFIQNTRIKSFSISRLISKDKEFFSGINKGVLHLFYGKKVPKNRQNFKTNSHIRPRTPNFVGQRTWILSQIHQSIRHSNPNNCQAYLYPGVQASKIRRFGAAWGDGSRIFAVFAYFLLSKSKKIPQTKPILISEHRGKFIKH